MESKQHKPPKVCLVCGDKSFGFNFHAITCESCKSFFRRHALQQAKLNCHLDENCIINNKLNRNYCKSCRLKKCLKIGMKRELLLLRKQRCLPKQRLNDPIKRPICKNFTDLKQHELAHLIEIRQAVAVIHEQEEDNLPVSGTAKDMIQLATLDMHALRKVVQFCQRFPTFKSLDPVDQVDLLNKFHFSRAVVQGCFHYDMEQQGCYMIAFEKERNTKTRVLVKSSTIQANTKFKSFLIYKNFTHTLHCEMENDPNIYDLLLTQLLFQNHENTLRREYICYNYHLYGFLLKRYLECKYANVSRAKDKFDSLMAILKEIDVVYRVFRNIYYQIVIQRNEQSDQIVDVFVEIHKILNSLNFGAPNKHIIQFN